MGSSITVGDLLHILLALAGLIALIALSMALFQLVRVLKRVDATLESNKTNIDGIIVSLEKTTRHAGMISEQTESTLKTVGPDVEKIVGQVGTIIDGVEGLTGDVTDTVHYFTDSVSDTVSSVKHGFSSAHDYLYYISEMIDIIKNALRR